MVEFSLIVSKAVVTACVLLGIIAAFFIEIVAVVIFLLGWSFLENWVLSLMLLLLLCFLLDSRCDIWVWMLFLVYSCFVSCDGWCSLSMVLPLSFELNCDLYWWCLVAWISFNWVVKLCCMILVLLLQVPMICASLPPSEIVLKRGDVCTDATLVWTLFLIEKFKPDLSWVFKTSKIFYS